MSTPSLFPDLVPVELEQVEKLSADRRRTLRQRADIQRGRHPLTRGPLTDDPNATCGNCRFRQALRHHNRSYPKCLWIPPSTDAGDLEDRYWTPPHVSHSAASDVRAWWPGCARHELGDPKVSPDAARWRP